MHRGTIRHSQPASTAVCGSSRCVDETFGISPIQSYNDWYRVCSVSAACAAPTPPPAPPMFSITMVPNKPLIRSAHGRAMVSKAPPGGNGTTIRTGRSGYLACAHAGRVRSCAESPAAPNFKMSRRRIGSPNQMATNRAGERSEQPARHLHSDRAGPSCRYSSTRRRG